MSTPSQFIHHNTQSGRFEVWIDHQEKPITHHLDGGLGLAPKTIVHASFHAQREGFDGLRYWRQDGGEFRRIPQRG